MALTTIKSSGTSFTGNLTVGSITADSVTTTSFSKITVICDDISGLFDSVTCVFPLTVSQTSINTVIDSRDVQVVVNGLILTPRITEVTYPWIREYDSDKGYRVVGANLIIYNPPDNGDSCMVTVTNTSPSVQLRTYPYSARTIALGD